MKPPCEIVNKKLLPAIRALVIKALAGHYTQAEIANLIGISQPAVNYYMRLIEKTELELKHPLVREKNIKKAAQEIVSSIRTTKNLNESIAITCNLCREMRISGPICAMHKNENPLLAAEQTCSLCHGEKKSIERIGKRVEVISGLVEAARILEGEGIEDLIPEIGLNIACALESPHTPEDIASMPGRIIKVKGRARAIGMPEFGVSPTLSEILIKLGNLGSKERCLVYVKNNEKVRAAIKKLRLGYVETSGADKDWNAALDQIAAKKDLKSIEIILDAGGVGLEPLAYILAGNPAEAVEKLRKIAGNS